jgi:hypothetical protein
LSLVYDENLNLEKHILVVHSGSRILESLRLIFISD